ncbi:hypothetical protein Bca4012_025891 [Brassica carinata]
MGVWEARNVKFGGELMWIDMFLIDVDSTVMQATINTHWLPKFRQRLLQKIVKYSFSTKRVQMINGLWRNPIDDEYDEDGDGDEEENTEPLADDSLDGGVKRKESVGQLKADLGSYYGWMKRTNLRSAFLTISLEKPLRNLFVNILKEGVLPGIKVGKGTDELARTKGEITTRVFAVLVNIARSTSQQVPVFLCANCIHIRFMH